MGLIETHAHIYAEQFKEDIGDVIERSRQERIEKIYMPNIDHTSIDDMLELENRYPEYCIPMMGLHPCSVKKGFEKELYLVEEWLDKRRFVAVGEIGTDLYWDKTLFDLQKEAFVIQCDLAIKHELPIVIHCRESIDETIDLLESIGSEKLTGIFHCFTGNEKQAKTILELGFKLGIGGVATFKNGGLEPILQNISLEHLVLETDSPYLAPTPYRGKRNEPAYIHLVAEKLAQEKGMTFEQVVIETSKNAENVFNS